MKLSELNILDLSSVLAGPLVGSFFAEHGARVLKVENAKTGGDVTRGWKLANEDPKSEFSSYYASANYNKELVLLDFDNEKDYNSLIKLIEEADIVIDNFRPRIAKKFSLQFEDLKKIKPSIIHAQITSYPNNKARPAYDVILQAESAFISMTGTDKDHLAKLPVAFIDLIASHQLRQGILTTLLERGTDQKAMKVEVSLIESALSALVNQGSAYLNGGSVAQPIGTAHPNIAPYGDLFECSDGVQVLFAVGSEVHWKKLCQILAKPELTELFPSNQARVQKREMLKEELNKLCRKMDSQLLLSQCEELEVPAARIQKIDESLNSAHANRMILEDSLGKRLRSSCFEITT